MAETMGEKGDKDQGVAEKSGNRPHDNRDNNTDDDLRAMLSKTTCQVFHVASALKF